jgi:hypothetical protein
MLNEHDRVVLTEDVPASGLAAGDVGVIVHVHHDHKAFEVEFMTLSGETVAVATILQDQLRPVSNRDITHARELGSVA